MELENLRKKITEEIKKGQFVSASWQSIKVVNGNEYKKISNGVVRLVKYSHIASVVVVGKVNSNESIDNQCEFIIHNSNTNKTCIQLSTTNVKPKCTYYCNGVEIDKATYEMANPPRKPRLDSNGNVVQNPVFRVYIENLLSLGNE